jgi:hypothetical protein
LVTVLVHPRFAIPYYAFYLEGLGRVFGYESIVFSRDGGPEETEFNDGFAVTIRGGDSAQPKYRRLYFSTNDFARYDRVALQWCDRYGMVNHDPSAAAGVGGSEKVVPIGASFGIRYWGGLGRTSRDIVRILRSAGEPPKAAFARLRGTRKLITDRLPEHRYVPGRSRADYAFFVAWPWKKHPEVNPPRARFMRACRAVHGLTFEGGFAPRRRKDVPDLDDVTADRIYPFRQWIRRTQESAVVFNCPAVHGCLGWKLGEFLALGKAIVSLPLSREMPSPLVHGEHIYYVEDDQEAMREAVAHIVGDDGVRTRLELGARRYYLEYLSPERVVQRLAFGS